jgi:hypothetical protein
MRTAPILFVRTYVYFLRKIKSYSFCRVEIALLVVVLGFYSYSFSMLMLCKNSLLILNKKQVFTYLLDHARILPIRTVF